MKRTAMALGLSIVFSFLIAFIYCSSRQITAEWIVDHQQRVVGRLGIPLGQVVELRGSMGYHESSIAQLGKNETAFYISQVDGKQQRFPIEYNEDEIDFHSNEDFTNTQESENIMCIAYETLEFYGDPFAADEIIQGPPIGLYVVLHVAQVKAR